MTCVRHALLSAAPRNVTVMLGRILATQSRPACVSSCDVGFKRHAISASNEQTEYLHTAMFIHLTTDVTSCDLDATDWRYFSCVACRRYLLFNVWHCAHVDQPHIRPNYADIKSSM